MSLNISQFKFPSHPNLDPLSKACCLTSNVAVNLGCFENGLRQQLSTIRRQLRLMALLRMSPLFHTSREDRKQTKFCSHKRRYAKKNMSSLYYYFNGIMHNKRNLQYSMKLAAALRIILKHYCCSLLVVYFKNLQGKNNLLKPLFVFVRKQPTTILSNRLKQQYDITLKRMYLYSQIICLTVLHHI